MTRELFEKAKFGDRFVTRGGQEALFLRLTENSEWQFADLYVKDWGQIRVNRENGKCLNGPDVENDIVGMMLSLPSGLDEAAEEYVKTTSVKVWGRIDPKKDLKGYMARANYGTGLLDGFRAGAEWMAGQYKTLGETEIYLEDDGGEAPYAQEWLDLATTEFAVPEGFKPGDKVIVQIRKKQ